MQRAVREYRIRGVATNLLFLETLLSHPKFQAGDYTTRFIDDTPDLLNVFQRRDRATKLLSYVADVTINGHPETRGRPKPPADARPPSLPPVAGAPADGTKQLLDTLGPTGFAAWMRAQKRVLVTDTTMRDAHQSLLATRMRTFDIVGAAGAYAGLLPGLFSLECWGGATFDVAMRFLCEDPWERLALVREKAPNILLQMLLRGANAVGYTNYPDNVVRQFVKTAADAGMDVFRIFDCLNWVENMRVSIDAVLESGKLAEGAICYTGDMLDPSRGKYSLRYYVDLAKELERAGCHILCIKDMAGLLKPAAARALIGAIRNEVALPIHLHTHDTSGIAAGTLLAAVNAGVDAVDVAMDSMSGLTSQPCLGSVVEALRHDERDTGLDSDAIRTLSDYWEAVRSQYAAFESDLKGGASEVYLHEMPGGQFTNLKEQARSLGLLPRWHEVARAYRTANDLFGDIVKVTPSSKVVGDMALLMVSQGLSPDDVVDPGKEIAFPASVVEMMHGDLGQPPGGWPEALQRKVLKGAEPITVRPGSLLDDVNLDDVRDKVGKLQGEPASEQDVASYLMYPKVYTDYIGVNRKYGPVSILPTPVYFYGMSIGDEITAELERGKSLIVRLQALGEIDEEGQRRVFFELNGQPRIVRVPDRGAVAKLPARRKAEDGNEAHLAAPMPGSITTVAVQPGQPVKPGDVLLTIEAMKMETALRAPKAGTVAQILVQAGSLIESKDLLVILE